MFSDPQHASFALAAVVAFAFAVEAALGFGAVILSLALGAAFMPVDQILPRVVPVNLGLAVAVAAQNLRHAEVAHLVRRVLPPVILGLPVGLWAFGSLDRRLLTLLLGVFVLLLALFELWGKGASAPRPPLSAPKRLFALFGSGVMHGAFASGGPMFVYVVARELEGKARFRATLALAWTVLLGVIVVSYAAMGRFTEASVNGSFLLLGSLVFGLFVGDRLHGALPEHLFRRLVYVLLAASGAFLVIRSALFG